MTANTASRLSAVTARAAALGAVWLMANACALFQVTRDYVAVPTAGGTACVDGCAKAFDDCRDLRKSPHECRERRYDCMAACPGAAKYSQQESPNGDPNCTRSPIKGPSTCVFRDGCDFGDLSPRCKQ
jgi:hypothetical protein